MLYPIELEAHVSRLNDLSLKQQNIIYSFCRFRQGGEPGFFKNFGLERGIRRRDLEPSLRSFDRVSKERAAISGDFNQ